MPRGLDKGERAGLVINECQRGMVDPEFNDGGLAAEVVRRGVLENIAELAASFRAAELPVFHSTIVMRRDKVGTPGTSLLIGALRSAGRCMEGNPEAEISPLLTPLEQDIVIQRRHGLTPFHGTELESYLRDLGVQTVVVTGVSTNVGVPGACLEALNRGFTAVTPEDGIAGAWPEAQEWQVTHTLPLLATVTTCAEIRAAIQR